MNIQVNGEQREVPADISVTELLRELVLDPEESGIAVAMDGDVILQNDWDTTMVRPESEVEIIHAVQGG